MATKKHRQKLAKVIRKRPQKIIWLKSGLEFLAHFLQYDFKSKDVEEMVRREPSARDPIEGTLNMHRLFSKEGFKAAWDPGQCSDAL